MIPQLLLGSCLIIATILISGVSFWIMESFLIRWRVWLSEEPHRIKIIFILCLAALWVLAQLTVGVWMWAMTFYSLEMFSDLETSVYFALVAITTLGLGDVILPQEWRILAGLAAANGMLNIGLLTAVMVEALRQVRVSQRAAVQEKERKRHEAGVNP